MAWKLNFRPPFNVALKLDTVDWESDVPEMDLRYLLCCAELPIRKTFTCAFSPALLLVQGLVGDGLAQVRDNKREHNLWF